MEEIKSIEDFKRKLQEIVATLEGEEFNRALKELVAWQREEVSRSRAVREDLQLPAKEQA